MTKLLNTTPKADGFRMPGEFEKHSGCWMVWPERSDNWRLGGKPAQKVFVEVAKAIHASEPVTMAVSAAQYGNARAMLPSDIRLVEMSSDDSWMRDIGPSCVINDKGERRAIDWEFNSWGGFFDGLYFPWDKDDAVAGKVAEIEGDDRYRAPIVLEGGSIHVDGEGTVYVTAECLLSEGRNPDLKKEEIEAHLCEYLGAEKVIWVPRGVYFDETTGHVDNIMHVVAPAKVVVMDCNDENDPQFERSKEAIAFLEGETDAKGRSIEVVRMPMPGPLFYTDEEASGVDLSESGMDRAEGDRLAGSYCNFYIANTRVILPLLDPKTDDEAIRILSEIFPDREIVGIDAREILLGGGNVHCITQQIPAK